MLLSGCNTTPVEVKNYKTECINGDCVNSKGTYTWLSGETYTGEFKDGKMHGKGTYTWLNGDTYTGDLKDGERHGYSTTTFVSEGATCKGEFRNNKRVGDVLCLYSDGAMFIGSLINGKYKLTQVATNKTYFNSNAFQNLKPRLYYDSLTGGMKECAYDQGMTGICSSFKSFNSNSYDKDTLFYNPSTGAMQNCAGVVSVNGKCSAYGIFNHSKATADKGQLYYDAKNKKMTTCLFVDLNGFCKHYDLVPNSWAKNDGGFRMTDPNNPYLKKIPQTSQDFIDLGMRMLSGGCTLGLDC